MSDGTLINGILLMILVAIIIYLIEHPDTDSSREKEFNAVTATITAEGKVIWTHISGWISTKLAKKTTP